MKYLVLIAILPVIILCYYIYKKDVDKEPKSLLGKVFVFGSLSVIPILFLELYFKNYFPTDDNSDLVRLFASTFMAVALIEEMAKWLVVYFGVYNNKEFNHPYDAIVYCVYASLGFALVENILYVISTNFYVGILRGVLTVPSHACDAIIMGYFLANSKKEQYRSNQNMSNRFMALSILIPITVHAVYDYLLFTQKEAFLIIFILFVSFIYITCFKLVKKLSKDNYNFDGSYVLLKNNIDDNNIRKKMSKKSLLYSMFITFIVSFLLVITAIILSTLLIN